MIQRIQSVYLAFIIIILSAYCAFDIIHLVEIESGKKATEFALNFFYFNTLENGILIDSQIQIILILLVSVVIGLSIIILINFKNRLKQMQFTRLNLVAILALLTTFTVKAYQFIPNFNAEKLMATSIISIAFMLFTVYLNLRVFFLIKKDEELVKSADRIR
jgi:hypothetical protein